MSDLEVCLPHAAEIIDSASYLVALTGAGISKESNIPTFRGKDGLWKNYDAMELATPQAFTKDSKLVWEWYSWRQNLISECEPNAAHETLTKWERDSLLKHTITQNVDNLHERAGMLKLIHVHGEIFKMRCTNCDFDAQLISPPKDVPSCPECAAALRPDVVWFGESLDPHIMNLVYAELNKADVILVIGTSGIVQPAASFPYIIKQNGGEMVEVNPERTPLSGSADIYLEGKAGEVLPMLDDLL